jgi:hypothetical protein
VISQSAYIQIIPISHSRINSHSVGIKPSDERCDNNSIGLIASEMMIHTSIFRNHCRVEKKTWCFRIRSLTASDDSRQFIKLHRHRRLEHINLRPAADIQARPLRHIANYKMIGPALYLPPHMCQLILGYAFKSNLAPWIAPIKQQHVNPSILQLGQRLITVCNYRNPDSARNKGRLKTTQKSLVRRSYQYMSSIIQKHALPRLRDDIPLCNSEPCDTKLTVKRCSKGHFKAIMLSPEIKASTGINQRWLAIDKINEKRIIFAITLIAVDMAP